MTAKPTQVKRLLDAAERAAKAHRALYDANRRSRHRERLPKKLTHEYNVASKELWEACYDIAGMEAPAFVDPGSG